MVHSKPSRLPSGGTFRLDPLTVRRDDDTFDLLEFEVLQDLSKPHHEPPLHPGLHWILLVQAILETDQLFQERRHALVQVFTQNLTAVAGMETSRGVTRRAADISGCHHFLFFYHDGNIKSQEVMIWALLSELPAVNFRYRGLLELSRGDLQLQGLFISFFCIFFIDWICAG